jgi:hypothetical protein
MSDFTVRSDSVDVEQIMKQIRTRIQEKRGVDYTEEQVRELATVRLEKFLDPKNLRSDLLEQFRKSRPPLPDPERDFPMPEAPRDPVTPEAPYQFDAETLYRSHRQPLRLIRRLLAPFLKLFFNPNTLIQVLHTQSQFNHDMLKRDLRRKFEFEQGLYEMSLSQRRVRMQSAAFERSRAEWNLLYYEVLHNLVFETTRMGMEVKNLRMRVEALASRLDFSERRVRALEGVVQYRPEAVRARSPQGGRPERDGGRDREGGRDRTRPEAEGSAVPADTAALPDGGASGAPAAAAQSGPGPSGESTGRRRRRRRRGRRGLGSAGSTPGAVPSPSENGNDEEDFGEGDELDTASDEASGDEPARGETREAAGEPDNTAASEQRAPTADPDQQ